MHRVLSLLFFAAACVSTVRADGCVPSQFVFNGGDVFDVTTKIFATPLPEYYCSGDNTGGGSACDINGGWSWTSVGVCSHTNGGGGEKCPCTAWGCDSGYCHCASSDDSTVQMCYSSKVSCSDQPPCPKTNQYLVGCGCVDCRISDATKKNFYLANAYYKLEHSCKDWPYSTFYACGPGSCVDCPPGTFCTNGRIALPCPAGQYQPSSGQGRCLPCALKDTGTYLKPGLNPDTACDPVKGWQFSDGTLLTCDECTDLSTVAPEILLTGGGRTRLCPPFLRGYGKFLQAVNDATCRPCLQCEGVQYAQPTSGENHCVTDQTKTQCQLMFNSNTDITAYYCTGVPTDPARQCVLTGGTIVTGTPMPWQYGFKRTLSEYRYIPGYDNSGLVPYYVACPAQTSSPHYVARTGDETALLDTQPWAQDCELSITRQCAKGYYAVVAPEKNDDGLTVLEECRPCGDGGDGAGGLSQSCTCHSGFALYGDLAAALPALSLPGNGLHLAPECVSCTGLSWQHVSDGLMYMEAIVCTGSTWMRCGGARQYVNLTACAQCTGEYAAGAVLDPDVICPAVDAAASAHGPIVARAIPFRNRTGCMYCPPGTFISSTLTCAPCPTGTFQPLRGQCGCRPKRTACPKGFMLSISASSEGASEDANCDTPCPTACPPGQLTISAPGLVNNTCDGMGGLFYACYDMVDGQAPSLRGGQRISYPMANGGADATGVRATVEACAPDGLPPYADFVQFGPSAAPGVECYFACQHGVNPAAALQYQKALDAYVRANREDLIPFLPPFSGGGQVPTTMMAVQKVMATGVMGYGGDNKEEEVSSEQAWAMHMPLATTTAQGGPTIWQNTFLYEEVFLAQFGKNATPRLCLSPDEAYGTMRCPQGLVRPRTFNASTVQCAMLARSGLMVGIAPGGASNAPYDTMRYAVLAPSFSSYATSATPLCLAEDSELAHFQVGCTSACLDQRLLAGFRVLNAMMPPLLSATIDPWYSRIGLLVYFLQPSFWRNTFDGLNPYQPTTAAAAATASVSNATLAIIETPAPFALVPTNASSSCAPTVCISQPASASGPTGAIPINTFRYSSLDHAGDGIPLLLPTGISLPSDGLTACVPCDYAVASGFGASVCHDLFSPPRFFQNDVCLSPPPGVSELTTKHVCAECAPLSSNIGTLMLQRDEAEIARWSDWWTCRQNQFTNDGWAAIRCRYLCPAGFTSNTLSPAAYLKTPCVPCPSDTIQAGWAQALCRTAGLSMQTVPTYIGVADDTRSLYQIVAEPVQCGASGDNYVPYLPACLPCDAPPMQMQSAYDPTQPMYVFRVGATNPVAVAGSCLALCNPSLYFSYDKAAPAGSPPITDPIPWARLDCRLCASVSEFACQGHDCADGYFQNASASSSSGLKVCTLCNTDPCPLPGTYREPCLGGSAIADAQCLPCPSAALKDDPASVPVRRWLSPAELRASPHAPWVSAVGRSPHPEACALACINNYAWLNASTGLYPSPTPYGVDLGALTCVPCASLSTERLYSVWNDTNITAELPVAAPGSALESMLQSAPFGGCRSCPGYGVRAVAPSSVRMCELRPGFTASGQMLGGSTAIDLAIVISVAPTTNGTTTTLVQGGPQQLVPTLKGPAGNGDWSILQRRRRALLQQQPQQQPVSNGGVGQFSVTLRSALNRSSSSSTAVMRQLNQRAPLARAPAFGALDHYACCDDMGSEDCREQRGLGFYALSMLSGTRVRDGCSSSSGGGGGRRRLLQYSSQFAEAVQAWFVNGSGTPPPEACYGGTFKAVMGDAPCAYCPSGASTTSPAYVAATSPDHCVCLPGFVARNLTRKQCVACPNATYRSPSQPEAGDCSPCPAGMFTPGPGSAFCYCPAGTYPNLAYGGCIACEAGFYCDGNQRTACPDHSVSPVGAASRSDCVCDPRDSYGDLSLPGTLCLPRPSGVSCLVAVSGSHVGCGCAPGWRGTTQTVGPSAALPVTATMPAGQRWLQCVSPCAAGQYAQVDPRTQALLRCVTCPVDTYAVDGSLVDACTPCPVGRSTSGRTGMTALANCSCIGTVGNASSSTCEGCPAGAYLDAIAKRCAQCPAGWTSAAGAVGLVGCACPPGAYALGNVCTPCPFHTYSHTIGLVCTPCPKGCVTDAMGQTSLRQCHCR